MVSKQWASLLGRCVEHDRPAMARSQCPIGLASVALAVTVGSA
jgi:hypothetical protein